MQAQFFIVKLDPTDIVPFERHILSLVQEVDKGKVDVTISTDDLPPVEVDLGRMRLVRNKIHKVPVPITTRVSFVALGSDEQLDSLAE